MSHSPSRKLRWPLLAAAAAALLLFTTTALAGSGVGSVFNLGQLNKVDATSFLQGTVNKSPQLSVVNNGSGPAIKAVSTTDSAINSVVNQGVPPLRVNSAARVANLNADLLDGLDSSALQNRVSGTCSAGEAIRVVNANGTVSCQATGGAGAGWSLSGNAGTTPGTNFLGTTDNKALELKVNGHRAFRLEPAHDIEDAEGEIAVNVIGGYSGNSVSPGAAGATIAGGGRSDNVNQAATYATVGGGYSNSAGGFRSVVAGGWDNAALEGATVSGGIGNRAYGFYSTVPGGEANEAQGSNSFAAGTWASAAHDGSFVWGDHTEALVTSPAANTFTVRAGGGIWLGTTSSPTIPAGRFLNTSTGGYLSSTGVWTSTSDRALKRDFRPLDKRSVLQKIARMPIGSWSYKAESASVRHVGPMAQDFYSAFGLGLDDKHIGTIDESGVALAAIQGLYRQNLKLQRQNANLQRENRTQDERLNALERQLSQLTKTRR